MNNFFNKHEMNLLWLPGFHIVPFIAKFFSFLKYYALLFQF